MHEVHVRVLRGQALARADTPLRPYMDESERLVGDTSVCPLRPDAKL
jgi:hypothetical protein